MLCTNYVVSHLWCLDFENDLKEFNPLDKSNFEKYVDIFKGRDELSEVIKAQDTIIV